MTEVVSANRPETTNYSDNTPGKPVTDRKIVVVEPARHELQLGKADAGCRETSGINDQMIADLTLRKIGEFVRRLGLY